MVGGKRGNEPILLGPIDSANPNPVVDKDRASLRNVVILIFQALF
jgi:hypothetical protein